MRIDNPHYQSILVTQFLTIAKTMQANFLIPLTYFISPKDTFQFAFTQDLNFFYSNYITQINFFWLFITLNVTQKLHCTFQRQNLRHDNNTSIELHEHISPCCLHTFLQLSYQAFLFHHKNIIYRSKIPLKPIKSYKYLLGN